jgi:hypothetical protein
MKAPLVPKPHLIIEGLTLVNSIPGQDGILIVFKADEIINQDTQLTHAH